jgi:hypothetical protein
MGRSIGKNKNIKKSRKKYLKRNKTKGKTREYRRTKNKRNRNKKSKNKRLTKRNKRYSINSREKFIRKKKIYQEGGVDKYFGTLTPEQVDILTYDNAIRRDIKGEMGKDKYCRITGCRSRHVLPKMLMMDGKAKKITIAYGMVSVSPFAENITYSVEGSEKQESIKGQYKTVSELCYWMIKVAEKGAQNGIFSKEFDPSRVEGGSICKVENYDPFNINSSKILVDIFNGLLDLILECLRWYKSDYKPDLEYDKDRHNTLKGSNKDQSSILDESLRYLEADFGVADPFTQGEKREQAVRLKGNLRSPLMESKIPSSEFAIGAYPKLCARLGFFEVKRQDVGKPMLDFMIECIPILKEMLNDEFFEELVEEVRQVKPSTEQAELTKATEAEEADGADEADEADEAAAAQVGWLSALPSWGKKAAEPGEIELTEMNAN